MSGVPRVEGAPASRALLWPLLMTLVMFGIAVSLGWWQIQRLHWKTALLTEIDRGEAAAPVALPPDPRPFAKVELAGHMRDDLAAYYGVDVRQTKTGPTIGAQLVTPLERPGADPVLIDRGWLPQGAPVPPSPDPARVVGYVRPPEPGGMFAAKDDPAARRFYALDPAAIGAALGLGRVAPFTIVALGPAGSLPEPAQALPRPPNNHLQYAITWFGLAAACLGVFAAYAWKTTRR
jgi:surfeit locus 1 family protein